MANKYECLACGAFYWKHTSTDVCRKCGSGVGKSRKDVKTEHKKEKCVVCGRLFFQARSLNKCCGPICTARNNARRVKQRYHELKAQGEYKTYAEKNFGFVSLSHRVIPTDPYRADNTSPDNGLPMTHVWNCIDNMAASQEVCG